MPRSGTASISKELFAPRRRTLSALGVLTAEIALLFGSAAASAQKREGPPAPEVQTTQANASTAGLNLCGPFTLSQEARPEVSFPVNCKPSPGQNLVLVFAPPSKTPFGYDLLFTIQGLLPAAEGQPAQSYKSRVYGLRGGGTAGAFGMPNDPIMGTPVSDGNTTTIPVDVLDLEDPKQAPKEGANEAVGFMGYKIEIADITSDPDTIKVTISQPDYLPMSEAVPKATASKSKVSFVGGSGAESVVEAVGQDFAIATTKSPGGPVVMVRKTGLTIDTAPDAKGTQIPMVLLGSSDDDTLTGLALPDPNGNFMALRTDDATIYSPRGTILASGGIGPANTGPYVLNSVTGLNMAGPK